MKRVIPLSLVCVLVLSGLGATAISESDQTFVQQVVVQLTSPQITSRAEYTTIEFAEATSTMMHTGAPMLPVVSRVFTFPLNTQISDISVDFSNWNDVPLEKPLEYAPSPQPLLPSLMGKEFVHTDEPISTAVEQYPEQQYTITKGVGLDGDEHVLYVSVQCIPVQYRPDEQMLSYAEDIEITITSQPPKQPVVFGDEYELFIITPAEFEEALQPFVEHKESFGVRTVVETVEDIYAAYDGRDEPEDIKLRIHDAIVDWGIDYVLLFGGRDGQSRRWHIPERRTHNDDGWESGYSSDLYYADIFELDESNITVFGDWDSNENDIFAEWGNGFNQRDYMDFHPDVKIGRIPVRYSFEIAGVLNKIIEYEQPCTGCDKAWFRKAVAISGDTFPPSRGGSPGHYEGEGETGMTADLFEGIGYQAERLFTSTETFTGPQDVIDAINAGAGYVHFAGHGNPAYWGNFLPDAETEEGMIDGLQLKHMPRLRNGHHAPIVVVGGCHNAQFNVTMANLIHDILTYGIKGTFFGPPYRYFYMEWAPWDWASMITLSKRGGAIATMGNSGLGYGYVDEHWNAGLGGWIEPRFFDVIVNQNKTVIADAHSQAITDYVNIIGGVNSDNIDRKTVEEWILMADPSMKIGGYDE